MWYGVFLWALVSSLSFHVPAALLALFTLRRHKYGRFMSLGLLLMGIVGPITAGILTSTAPAALRAKNTQVWGPWKKRAVSVGWLIVVWSQRLSPDSSAPRGGLGGALPTLFSMNLRCHTHSLPGG